jgi:hypothetical protein
MLGEAMGFDVSWPQLSAALAGLGGVIVGGTITWWMQASLLSRRIEADEGLAKRKIESDEALAKHRFEFDKDLAERKFKYDREFHDHKRRAELAETILAEFLRMRDVIQGVRSPLAYGGEAVGRIRKDGETEEEARQRDSYYVPIARLMKESEFISGLMSKRYRSRAVLGAPIDQAFQEILKVINRIQASSNTLMRMVGVPGRVQQRNEDLIARCEADIWSGLPEDDQLQPMVNQAVEIVENVCRPILERAR